MVDKLLQHAGGEFEIRGFHEIACVCSDMQRTTDFYTNVLGMRLAQTTEGPDGSQKFVFDFGNGVDRMAFYWFPDAPPSQPGIAQSDFFTSVKEGGRDITTATGSMNHFAFDVAPDKIEAYREVLINEGLQVTDVWNHSDRPGVDQYMPAQPNEDTFIRSIYFPDPDGIVLEFACWGRPLTEDDVIHEGKRESDLARNRT